MKSTITVTLELRFDGKAQQARNLAERILDSATYPLFPPENHPDVEIVAKGWKISHEQHRKNPLGSRRRKAAGQNRAGSKKNSTALNAG